MQLFLHAYCNNEISLVSMPKQQEWPKTRFQRRPSKRAFQECIPSYHNHLKTTLIIQNSVNPHLRLLPSQNKISPLKHGYAISCSLGLAFLSIFMQIHLTWTKLNRNNGIMICNSFLRVSSIEDPYFYLCFALVFICI